MCCQYRCENDFCCAISLFTQKGERFRMTLRLLLLSVAKISSPCVTYLVPEYQNQTWGIMERFDIIREMNVSEKKGIFVWCCGMWIQICSCYCSMDTRGVNPTAGNFSIKTNKNRPSRQISVSG